MAETRAEEKARRRAASEMIATYHQAQQIILLERVRAGFDDWDAGRIDAFDLDELINRYHRASQRLFSFCGVGGIELERAASALEHLRESGDEPDWWKAAAPRRRR